MSTRVPVLIIGGGISGLVCAYALRKSSVDARLVEAAERLGGAIRSERREGYLLELGPQSFSSTASLLDLCREVGIEEKLIAAPARAPRYLLVEGRLRPAPLSPPAFFGSSLFSAKTKWSLLRDAFGRSTPGAADESIAAFTRRKFTPELLDKLVGPFVSGIYAGDPERLSLRATFPQLHEAERSSGSVIRGMLRAAKAAKDKTVAKSGPRQRATLQTFRDGNETLVEALGTSLGAAVRVRTEVIAVRRDPVGEGSASGRFFVEVKSEAGNESIVADQLVLATPPDIAAQLLATFMETTPEQIHKHLAEIEFAPIAVVSLGYPKASVGHSLDGFGFLIPRSEKIRTLGTVFNSFLFAGRAPEGRVLLTSFVGGVTDAGVMSLGAEEIVAIVHRELAAILSISQRPTFSHVQIYERALPQYNLGHTERLASVQNSLAAVSGLFLAGNYLRGPAIGACIEQALSVAEAVRARAKEGSAQVRLLHSA